MKGTIENMKAVMGAEDVITIMDDVAGITDWNMDTFAKAVKRVMGADVSADDVMELTRYYVTVSRAHDYEVARTRTWDAYIKWDTKESAVVNAITFAKKRGGDAGTYRLKGEDVPAEVYRAYCAKQANTALERHDRLYNEDLEDALKLRPVIWGDGEDTASVLCFLDLVAFTVFGYVKPMTRANIAVVENAVRTACTFATENARTAGEKTEDTSKAFNALREALRAMFTHFGGENIKLNAKEVLYCASVFGHVEFSVGTVKDVKGRDVYVTVPTERANLQQICRLTLYKLEGKKIGDEFK